MSAPSNHLAAPAAVSATPAASVRIPESFRRFLWLCLALAGLKLAIQIAGNILAQRAGYGIFRDEMYYLICGRHLAFGYVDQPPLVALQARLTEIFFGYHEMWSLRLFSGIAGAAKVFLTGTLVWAMGAVTDAAEDTDRAAGNHAASRRAAALLAMLGVTVAPVCLGIDSFLSMNSFEPVFWMTCALALLRIVYAHGVPGREHLVCRWWIILGLSAGLGLENKVSEVFFLVAVLIALLLTPQRRILASRWFAVAVALAVALALPNLIWQMQNHWPTLEWLIDVKNSGKDVQLPPLQFLASQIMMFTPWVSALWISGFLWLLFARRACPIRFLGVLYFLFLPLMMALHAKDYYLAPIYPIGFAAGGLCWLPYGRRSLPRHALVAAYALLLVAGFFLTVPFSIPVLPPRQMVAWMNTMHYKPPDAEVHAATPLPEFYADRFGWHEMVAKVAAVYNALPPDQRAVTGILVSNYGEASAINLFGRQYGLPVAISGHQNYWLWGPHGYTGQEMILILDATPAELAPYYASCALEGRLDDPLAMPWEHKPIYLCRGRNSSYAADWKDFKSYH